MTGPGLAAAGLAWTAPLTALVTAWWATAALRRAGGPRDRPTARSLHSRPVPRTGGLAILGGLLAGTAVTLAVTGPAAPLAWIGAGGALVALISAADDWRGVAPPGRLLVHVAAALVLGLGGLFPAALGLPGGAPVALPTGVAWALGLLWTVWLTNLYNFMDGMDGCAAGMAVIGFGALGALGLLGGAPALGLVSLCVAAAAAGFLRFNFPPAGIFMGDTGAATLGFLAAALGLWGARSGVAALWQSLLIFSPFVVDATVTLGRRTLRGARPWEAHCEHCYQRLVRMGWGHRRTVLWAYGLMSACAVSAVGAAGLSPAGQRALAGIWVMIYIVLLPLISRLEARHRSRRHR